MTERDRKIFFYFVVILFLFSAPLLTLYTGGYRLYPKNLSLTQLGGLIIETNPENATIFLDGKMVSHKTPARIQGLQPGQYHLRLEGEGHFPWEKNIIVKKGETNLLLNIPLFLNAQQEILEKDTETFLISHTYLFREKLAWVKSSRKSKEIYQITFPETEERKLLFRKGNSKNLSIKLLGYSWDLQFLLIEENKKFFLLNTVEEHLEPLEIPQSTIESALWTPGRDEILLTTKKEFILFDPFQNKSNSLYEKKDASSAFVLKDAFFLLYTEKNGSRLLKYPREDMTHPTFVVDLPEKTPEFLSGPVAVLTIFDQNEKRLKILDSLRGKVLLDEKAKEVAWKEDTLFYGTQVELFRVELKTLQKELLARYSVPLGKIFPLPRYPYIGILLQGQLHLVEENIIETPLMIQLLPDGEKIDDFSINKKSNFLVALSQGKLLLVKLR